MGFIVDFFSILVGGLIGGIFSKRVNIKNTSALAIGIMLISTVGLLENILCISEEKIVGEHTVVVAIALVAGCAIGEALRLKDRLYSLPKTANAELNGFIDSVLFFGIGGLQISGPILYALDGDSFQLVLKGIVDFPFALMLGAAYGKKASLSAFPVAFVQVVIALLAVLFGDFLSDNLLCQMCSLGYIILFFSGFNMVCSQKSKIKNINMVPGMFLIIIYNIVREVLVK